MKKMVTSSEFAEKMNALDPEAVALEPVGENEQQVFQQELQATEDKGEVRANDEGPSAQPSENPVPSDGTMVEEVENEANEDSVDEADDQLDDEIEDGDNNNKESNQNGGHDDDHVSSSLQLRRSSRIRGGIKKPSRYAMVAKKLRNKMIRSEELQSKGR
jgi:hypothetical protein